MKTFKTGDILFVRGHSLMSRIVKLTDGEYSHCAVAMNDDGHILEAQSFTKSRIVPIYFNDYDVVHLSLTEEQRHMVVDMGIRLTGIPYDYSQAIGYLIEKIFKFNKNHFLDSPDKLICSELVDLLLYLVGYIEEYIGDKTPNQLHKYLVTKEGGNV
ncbi:hypothetical protein M5X17_27550 [Paenibacillus alvei]|uniref:hypothetical protein n=1 Tax=Paenibacillus alvei TaxID=44250 RepID=UPI00227DA5E0|nr:hypothetical protein [Paenibacillus alvei]MCY9737461.1 hypothetical protein [Paenibacillus alvei]